MYRILIVDDEPMICKGLSKTIERAEQVPSFIQTAEDGCRALEMIETFAPDFVFTDIRMSRMDGLELCRTLFERYPDIQVVVVSGYGEFEYAQKCITYGVTDYLLKPITKGKVQRALNRLVEQHRAKHRATIFSPMRIEAWVDRMAEEIWQLREDDLRGEIERWEREFAEYGLNREQQLTLLTDFLEMLAKQLEQRGYDKVAVRPRLQEADAAHLFSVFSQAVIDFLAQLRNLRKGKSKDPIEEAKHYIEENLAKEVSLEEVAEMLGLNPSYFSQYFKLRTSETFIQYRIRRRMEKAKRLLEMPHYRITDISYEIGYADHPHFTKTFKKNIGVSPSEYRKMMGIE